MGDSNQQNNQTVQAVTSVGNSWIICRSKSHAGRIYYFNTFSGEAAWNLSDQEIEKAKTRTKILESQSGEQFDGCPEPKDPPMDNNRNSKSPQTSETLIPSRVYNKQIINNQFSKQTLPPGIPNQCSSCRSLTTFDAMGINMSVPHSCHSNVWTIPPHHQIVMAPSTILNQTQESVNSPFNNVEQRVSVEYTSLPLSHRFNRTHVVKHNKHVGFANANGFNKRYSNNGIFQTKTGSPYYKKNYRFTDSVDLRQRLTARRRSNNTWNNSNTSIFQDEEMPSKESQRIQIIKPSVVDIIPSNADDHWLKENATVQGTQLFLNVTPLKQKVSTDIDSTFYVVVDTSVLLNHISLINVIVNSDETCQLMVPDFVMAALQTKSRANDSELLSRAHYVLQMLSRQFSAGKAVMGKDPTSDGSIYDFCLKLSAQDYDVVLISNNVYWKKNDSVITLNVQELKDMLSNVVKPKKRLEDDYGKIQITIPNDSNVEKAKAILASKTTSIGIQFDTYKEEFSEMEPNLSVHCNVIKDDTKRTVDIGTQTDKNSFQNSCPKKVNSLGVNTEPFHMGEKSKDQIICDRDVTDSVQLPKQKEIRLKRNLSHQPVTDNVERKEFKWRRKRNAPMKCPNATNQKATSYRSESFNIEDISKGNQQSGPASSGLNNIIIPESRSTCYDPVDGSETSSSCFIQNSLGEKIVIEETSTSGVISNSADSESIHSMKHNEQVFSEMLYHESDDCKCVMFEVESPIMEENLKMRSDEWVSRFVQIMEEVLTQILQQTPTFFNRTLPPPWTVHEATECIKKKFENDSDVKDAANRLTNVLFKVSDGQGKISVDLKPHEFMEMYSYGVYLVDALQSVLSNSEDLQTASDSLAKLLTDIQDPTHDTSHTDGFLDCSHLPPADVTEASPCNIIHDEIKEDMPKPEEKKLPDLKSPTSSSSNDTKGKKYNLRSRKNKSQEDEVTAEQSVKFIRKIDIESTFFSSLHLKKNQNTSEEPNRIVTNSSTCPNSLSTSEQNMIADSLSRNSSEDRNDKPNNEPRIIRNFSTCLEIEERLKNKLTETMEMDTSDYIQNNDDFDDDSYDYYDDYSYYENEEESEENETYDDNKENQSLDIAKTINNKNGNNDLKSIIHRLVNEVQETFLGVESFCADIVEELSVSKTLNVMLSPPRKLEIKRKAETARCVVDNLIKTLNRIISREGGNCENSILNIFKTAGIDLDGNKIIEYRDFIAQYPRQAMILLDAVDIVIEAVK